MFKTIIKELIIFLLLLVSIALLLGILFYDYIPNTKEAPAKVPSYALEEEVQTELNTVLSNQEETVISTYTIDDKDLTKYEEEGRYDRGKTNPFAEYTESTPPVNTPSGNNTGTGNNNSGIIYNETEENKIK